MPHQGSLVRVRKAYLNGTFEHFFHKISRPFIMLHEVETTVGEVRGKSWTLGSIIHESHIFLDAAQNWEWVLHPGKVDVLKQNIESRQ